MPGLAPRIPLDRGGPYGYPLVKTTKSAATQHLKMLLLTAPGERMMDPAFGVGLRNFLFEQKNDTVYANMVAKIREQVSIYTPYINIVDVLIQDPSLQSTISENNLVVRIVYSIPSLDTQDQLDLIF